MAKLGDLLEFGELWYFFGFLDLVIVLKRRLVGAHKSFFQIGTICAVFDDVGGAGQHFFGIKIAVAQPKFGVGVAPK